MYTHLPGNMSLRQLEHCAPNDSASFLLSRYYVFATMSSPREDAIDHDFLSLLPGNAPVRLSRVTRCLITTEATMDEELFLALVIAWL